MLTLATLELREHGILEAMRKKWWHPKKACPEPKKSSVSVKEHDRALCSNVCKR